MPHWLKQGFTDEKNDHDAFLLGYGIGLAGIVVLTSAAVFQGHPPSLTEFAQSFGYLTGGCGLGYGIKRAGEKYASPPSTDSTVS